jgi:hypothetical protein
MLIAAPEPRYGVIACAASPQDHDATAEPRVGHPDGGVGFEIAATTDDLYWAGDVVEAVATHHLSIGLPDHAAPARGVDSAEFAARLTETVTSFLLARAKAPKADTSTDAEQPAAER